MHPALVTLYVDPDMNERDIAVHELGHAIAVHLYHRPLYAVEIHHAGEHEPIAGECWHGCRIDTKKEAVMEIIIAMSGPLNNVLDTGRFSYLDSMNCYHDSDRAALLKKQYDIKESTIKAHLRHVTRYVIYLKQSGEYEAMIQELISKKRLDCRDIFYHLAQIFTSPHPCE